MSGRDMPVAVGDLLLGKYWVERVLGKGGMGVVVAARHIDLDELFAVKLMLDRDPSSAASERFLREARAAAKLKGEHAARVIDVGLLTDGTPYILMEHLEGSDLRRVLRERGPLPAAEVVTYVLQACETLSEAHSLGIIHRDVKPANMFLTRRRNGSPCVKLLDFGISKQTRSDEVSLTTTAGFGGSPLYMSPEQMRSAKHVDTRTDIWSVGVALYELLTGTSPFQGESVTEVTSRVLQDDPPPPGRVVADIPPALDAVVLRCLAKRPDDRFATVDELISALRASMGGPPVTPFPHVEAPTAPLGRASLASIAGPLTGAPAAPTPPLPLSMGDSSSGIGSIANGQGSTSVGFGQISSPLAPPPPVRAAIPLLLVLGGAFASLVAIGAFVFVGSAREAGSDSAAAAAISVSAPASDSPLPAPSPTVAPAPEPAVTASVTASAEPSTTAVSKAPTTAPLPPATSPVSAPKPATGQPQVASPKPSATGKKRRTID